MNWMDRRTGHLLNIALNERNSSLNARKRPGTTTESTDRVPDPARRSTLNLNFSSYGLRSLPVCRVSLAKLLGSSGHEAGNVWTLGQEVSSAW